jgi:hypothetical protein
MIDTERCSSWEPASSWPLMKLGGVLVMSARVPPPPRPVGSSEDYDREEYDGAKDRHSETAPHVGLQDLPPSFLSMSHIRADGESLGTSVSQTLRTNFVARRAVHTSEAGIILKRWVPWLPASVMRWPRARWQSARRKRDGKRSRPDRELERAGTNAAQGKTRHPWRRPLGPVQWVLIASASARPHQLLIDDVDERRQRLCAREQPAVGVGAEVARLESHLLRLTGEAHARTGVEVDARYAGKCERLADRLPGDGVSTNLGHLDCDRGTPPVEMGRVGDGGTGGRSARFVDAHSVARGREDHLASGAEADGSRKVTDRYIVHGHDVG